VGVQKEITTDILRYIPFRYIAMQVTQHIVQLYEKVLLFINIRKSKFRSPSRNKRVSERWKNVGWSK
jgi:hypothetical protein